MTLALDLHVVKDGLEAQDKRASGRRTRASRKGRAVPNLSPRLVVVEVHEWATCRQALGSLWFVHKRLREGHAVGQVVAASRPLEPFDETLNVGAFILVTS